MLVLYGSHVPYLRKVSHALKKLGRKVKVDVIFSAPQKLLSLCSATDPFAKKRAGCKKKHQPPLVSCVKNVVYCLPLSCGKVYIGQSGRCLNDRLRTQTKIESIPRWSCFCALQ